MIPRTREPQRGNGFLSPQPTAEAVRPRMRLLSFKPMVKNSLRGFATVELLIGLRISDIPVLVGKNGAWATLPSKPQVDKDGQIRRDPNGKVLYSPVLEWADRNLANRFSEAVVSLVRVEYPTALACVAL